MHEALRAGHYSYLTEKAYVGWIRRYIRFHRNRHPRDMGAPEITSFLTSLATEGNVAASTQNQALNAILFLYRKVLRVDLPWMADVVRARKPSRLPIVMTPNEVGALLAQLDGTYWLIASLLYGSSVRPMECLTLRVKDIEISRRQILVRRGKGNKDRVTVLPTAVVPALQLHLERRHCQHQRDSARGSGSVYLPDALRRKYPSASREWGWQFVFAAGRRRHRASKTRFEGTVASA